MYTFGYDENEKLANVTTASGQVLYFVRDEGKLCIPPLRI